MATGQLVSWILGFQQLQKPVSTISTVSFHNVSTYGKPQLLVISHQRSWQHLFQGRRLRRLCGVFWHAALWCCCKWWEGFVALEPFVAAGYWYYLQITSDCWSSDTLKPNHLQSVETFFFCSLANSSSAAHSFSMLMLSWGERGGWDAHRAREAEQKGYLCVCVCVCRDAERGEVGVTLQLMLPF